MLAKTKYVEITECPVISHNLHILLSLSGESFGVDLFLDVKVEK